MHTCGAPPLPPRRPARAARGRRRGRRLFLAAQTAVGHLDSGGRLAGPRHRGARVSMEVSYGPPHVGTDDVLRRNRNVRVSARDVRSGAPQRPSRLRPAAWRVRRACRGRSARRPAVSYRCAVCCRPPGGGPRGAQRALRARARPGAFPGAVAEQRAGRAARDGDPVSNTKPLRRPGYSRDRHRPSGRVV